MAKPILKLMEERLAMDEPRAKHGCTYHKKEYNHHLKSRFPLPSSFGKSRLFCYFFNGTVCGSLFVLGRTFAPLENRRERENKCAAALFLTASTPLFGRILQLCLTGCRKDASHGGELLSAFRGLYLNRGFPICKNASLFLSVCTGC
jgi:hypothetical protein